MRILTSFESSAFRHFLAVKVIHTKTTVPKVLMKFSNAMKLIQNEVSEKIKSVQWKNITRQERGIGRTQNTFFRKDPVRAPSNALPIASSWPAAKKVVRNAAKDPSMRLKRDMGAKTSWSRRQSLGFETGSAKEVFCFASSDPEPTKMKRSVSNRGAL